MVPGPLGSRYVPDYVFNHVAHGMHCRAMHEIQSVGYLAKVLHWWCLEEALP